MAGGVSVRLNPIGRPARDRRRRDAPARRAALAWAALAGLLAGLAIAGWWLTQPVSGHAAPIARGSLDWQPGLALAEPWRAWTAVAVHYSRLHLAANLAGAVLTAAFGITAGVPARAAWAWLAAWPLTQFGLWVAPALPHYGGLSGVLHAGVATVVVWLLATGSPAQRLVGGAVLAGLLAKLVGEAPWGTPLRHPPGWDIAVAPIAHVTGLVAGGVCGVIALARPCSEHRKSSP